MLGWGKRQEKCYCLLFFFLFLFFVVLVICYFIHRKYTAFLFNGLKVNLIYIRGKKDFFLLSLYWRLILVNVDLQ